MATQLITFTSGVSTYVADGYDYQGKELYFSGISMYMVDINFCADFAVTYLNAYGGWDVFAFPMGERTDNYTQFDYTKTYDNRGYGFGRMRQITEIAPTWKLTSGWLKPDEAARFVKHLLPSAQVYLTDIANNVVYPVTITDSKAEHKTQRYSNALINYTLNVKASQDLIRR